MSTAARESYTIITRQDFNNAAVFVKMPAESRDSLNFTLDKARKPPFKLCFAKHQETGRSDAYFNKVNAHFITPKFYARELNDFKDNEQIEDIASRIEKDSTKTPKLVYPWPTLSSHTYGWWHEKGIQPKDIRFNYHKRTSDLVSFQMKIYNEDQKLKGENC